MRLIDADELIKVIQKRWGGVPLLSTKKIDQADIIVSDIDAQPTVDPWHYPSKGELPDKDWSKHPLNVSKNVFVLTKRGIGTIARWDNDYKMWFENQPKAPVTEVIAWQYFVPPKENV